MCEHNHRHENYLTLFFALHHTIDSTIIDDILLQTICTLDTVEPAILDREETRKFNVILSEFPEELLTKDSVEDARAKERAKQDALEKRQSAAEGVVGDEEDSNPVNGVYRILKNSKIIGQLLRNKYGNLERE